VKRLLALLATAALVLPACESTQSKSARLEREGGGALREKGVVVTRQSPDVKVVSTGAVQDENGTAVVVRVRNTGRRALAQVPISIDVRGRSRKSLFRNDDPGLEPTLVHAPLLRPGEEFGWVNDQVTAAERPQDVRAKVGEGPAVDAARVPRISLTRPRLRQDPVSGVAAAGFAANRSRVEQRKLIVFAVARKGSRVVAAGRAQINRLQAGKRARYTVFFIGNPRGARISVSAPPTRLGGDE